MTKEQRSQLTSKITTALNTMTEDKTNRESSVDIGGHTVARQLVYAGGSQWCQSGREWDRIELGWAWIVDDQHHLTSPDLFGFDGHNMIERQTGFYLADTWDEYAEPEHDGRAPLSRVPATVIIDIGRGLVDAQRQADAEREATESTASEILSSMQ